MTKQTVQTSFADDEGPSFPTGRTLLCAVLGFGGIYLIGKKADAALPGWGWLLVGLAVLLFTIMDARAGWTFLCHRPVSRSKEPALFWVCIVTASALGVGSIGFSMGALLGY